MRYFKELPSEKKADEFIGRLLGSTSQDSSRGAIFKDSVHFPTRYFLLDDQDGKKLYATPLGFVAIQKMELTNMKIPPGTNELVAKHIWQVIIET